MGQWYQRSFADLSPNYSATLFAIGHGISCVVLIISPYVTGMLIEEESSLYTWRLVFLITAGAYAGSALIFACLVPATVQEWNFPKKPICDLVKVEPSVT